MFLGFLLASWIDNFERVGIIPVCILGLMTLITVVLDIASSIIGAKRYGASKTALWGAAIGGVIGIFGGLIGIFLGPLIGALIGEFIVRQNLYRAGQIGIVTAVSVMIGMVLKLAVAASMILLFLSCYFL
jgi:uncharacterized protein YqgC (DUF456 family)